MGTNASSAAAALEFPSCCDSRSTANSLNDSANHIDDDVQKSWPPNRITPARVDFEDDNPASYGPGFALLSLLKIEFCLPACG